MFGNLDLAVLVVYLAGTTAWGAWLGRGQTGGSDYFLGRHAIPWPAVMLSVVATETSSLTFLSIPGYAYNGNLGFLQIAMGYCVGRVVIAAFLLPAYYKGDLTTAYALLQTRFGLGVRRFTSAIFMAARLMGDSVRLFVTAIPLALILELPYTASILLMSALTLVYTYLGGIKAVIWVDVAQLVVYLAGAGMAMAILHGLVPGGWPAILSQAGQAGKLAMVSTALDLSKSETLWAGLVGGGFLSMGSHGADQLIVQRLLTCPDLRSGQKALAISGAVVLAQFALFLLVGTGLWVYYAGRPFRTNEAIFTAFIIEKLPAGLRGLTIAGIFAAAMSTLSSSVNALASTTTYDFYAPARGLHRDDPRLLSKGKYFTLVWGLLLTVGALVYMRIGEGQIAVTVALSIASLVYGALLGAFALAVFSPRATTRGVSLGMLVGIVAMTFVWIFLRAEIAWPWYVFIGTLITSLFGILLR